MFILTISCLTMSNLTWFMNPTFQAPMQYCSLQHRILLSSANISTAEGHFCFGPVASFFLALLVVVVHSSPVAYWTPSNMGTSFFWCHTFLPFYTAHEILTASILEWFAIPSSSGSHFVRILHYDVSFLGGHKRGVCVVPDYFDLLIYNQEMENKGTTEDEMAGWHHRLNGHGFGWTPGVGDGQGGLVCCGSWGHKELDTTERLNWTEPGNESGVGLGETNAFD